jgi:hypothetical protein
MSTKTSTTAIRIIFFLLNINIIIYEIDVLVKIKSVGR